MTGAGAQDRWGIPGHLAGAALWLSATVVVASFHGDDHGQHLCGVITGFTSEPNTRIEREE